MTNREILKKAIIKVNRNGAKLFGNLLSKREEFRLTLKYQHIEIFLKDDLKIIEDLYGLIFSHDLLKLFGAKKKLLNTELHSMSF